MGPKALGQVTLLGSLQEEHPRQMQAARARRYRLEEEARPIQIG